MNIAQTKTFLLSGRAVITVRSKVTDIRFTYGIKKADFAPNSYFVGLLSGSDNNFDYQYMGMLHAAEEGRWYMRQTTNSRVKATARSWLALAWFLGAIGGNHDAVLTACEWWHEGQCGRCGRRLTVPESIERGIGPVCAGM